VRPRSAEWKEGAFAALDGARASANPYHRGRVRLGVPDPNRLRKYHDWKDGCGWALGKVDMIREEIRSL
jgi:hypothetical protein